MHRNPIVRCFAPLFCPNVYVGVLLLYIEGNRVIYSMTFRTPDHHFPMVVFILGCWKVRRVLAFLFILFPFSVFAECVSVNEITKCARLPNSIGMHNQGTEITDAEYGADGWGGVYNGHVLSGTGVNSGSGMSMVTTCVIEAPFFAEGVCYFNPAFDTKNGNYNCANATDACDIGLDFNAAQNLEGDVCPDGFYTVPYEISCGEGFVDVSGLPQCDVDASGDYCLIAKVSAAPCAAGITTLRTGTGVSVPLWAERGTEPSLCVEYNNIICYGNLEVGQATNAVNVEYNNQIYHLVD